MYKWILSSKNGSIDFLTDNDIFMLKVEGKGHEKTINYSEMYGYDGGHYESATAPVRHISAYIQFYNKDVEAARMRLDRILAAPEVTLRYVSDYRDVYITGNVENTVTNDDELPVIGQINITCTDPYWKASGDNSHVISGTESCFEFPIEIDEDEGMEFGRIESALIVPIYNEGTADSGAVFTFTAITACSNPRIENVDTGEFMEVAVDMAIGDVLVVDTRYDSKSISFTHEGVTEDYFNKRSARSDFFQIRSGYNYLKYTVGTGDEHALDITVNFDARYGGI